MKTPANTLPTDVETLQELVLKLQSQVSTKQNKLNTLQSKYQYLLEQVRLAQHQQFASAPLFLRKLVLGIPAQASGKNHVAINAFGAPIRPAFVSLRHIIASSMQTP